MQKKSSKNNTTKLTFQISCYLYMNFIVDSQTIKHLSLEHFYQKLMDNIMWLSKKLINLCQDVTSLNFIPIKTLSAISLIQILTYIAPTPRSKAYCEHYTDVLLQTWFMMVRT